jgi:hypothetical protein
MSSGETTSLLITTYVLEWRKLPNEELNDLHSSANIVRVINSRTRRTRNLACMRDRRGIYRIVVGNPEGKGTLGRPKCRWENNIKIDRPGSETWGHGLDPASSE